MLICCAKANPATSAGQGILLGSEGRIAILPSWITPSRKVSGNRYFFNTFLGNFAMKNQLTHTFFTTMLTLSASAFFQVGMAANLVHSQITIDQSSIDWNDATARAKLLKRVPIWKKDEINKLFDAYSHPEQFKLPRLASISKFNIQFINAFWGPLDNPFVSTMRPAKAFVLLDHTANKSTSYFVAPVFKNASDKNYYVFDSKQSKPILLSDWVTGIQHEHGNSQHLRFNVCKAYGSIPEDSCEKSSYQDETQNTTLTQTSQIQIKSKLSAHREFNQDWKSKLNQYQLKSGSIYDSAVTWNDIAARNTLLNTVVSWPSLRAIKANFLKIRDIRYFTDTEVGHFTRRISWLYPDDGCWTRAAASIKDMFGPLNNINIAYARPSKVFAFGNLCANTSNSKAGAVAWWYHTAPIVKDAATNQTYVLDPSVSPKKVLTMEEWVEEISSHTGVCGQYVENARVDTISVCSNGYGNTPDDECESDYLNEVQTTLGQPSWQSAERERQLELGRDANAVLGDLPPWLNR